MQPLQAVLFDLDGTLIDSRPEIVSGMQKAFESVGLPPPTAKQIDIGAPLLEMVTLLLEPYGQELHSTIVKTFRDDYVTSRMHLSKPFPGVPELLRDLRSSADGVRLYVATAKSEVYAKLLLEHLQFAPLFDGIYGAELNGNRTNKVELLAYLLQREGLDGRACMMVGDREFDMIGAKANGLMGVGVRWGYGVEAELRAHGADAMVSTTAELIDAIHARRRPVSA